jgi:uncharacterized protein YuzE
MKTTYDKTADAAYIRLNSGPVAETLVVNDLINVDVDGDGRIIGVELLAASEQIDPGTLQNAEYRDLVAEGGTAYGLSLESADTLVTATAG